MDADGDGWWCGAEMLPARGPSASNAGSQFRKYAFPGSRSQRNLAILRRVGALRPCLYQNPNRCSACRQMRRIGRWWTPPSARVAAMMRGGTSDARRGGLGKRPWLYFCDPCWYRWNVVNRQWFVSDDKDQDWYGWVFPSRGKRRSTATQKTSANKRKAESVSSNTGTVDNDADGSNCGGGATRRQRKARKLRHFHFVEIGTSHYHTFTQAVAGHPDGKPWAWNFLDWNRHPLRQRGLAVDMKQSYLDQLPELPRVTKVRAAVSEHDGVSKMHHVPLADIEHWEAVFAARGNHDAYRSIRLARGCSALGRHRVLRKMLSKIGMGHLLKVKRVRTCSVGTLLRRCSVRDIEVLALDCEGHDCAILRGLIRAGKERPNWFPRWIVFETNGMNDDLFGKGTEERTVQALQELGYDVWWNRRDTVLERLW